MNAFFDSNVVLYSAGSDPAKAERSDRLRAGDGWISVQVLNEVANVSQRKMKHSWSQTIKLLDTIKMLLTVANLTVDVHERGLEIARRHKLALYDAMIVAAALTAGCDVLYSEDMHDGLVVDGALTVRNPFV